jgi:hypothetical protein
MVSMPPILRRNAARTAVQIFSGSLGGSTAGEVPPGPDSRLPFDWTTPFHDDPLAGNLLLVGSGVAGLASTLTITEPLACHCRHSVCWGRVAGCG